MNILTQDGHTFTWRVDSDNDWGTPWENSDGHGPVRCALEEYKRAGERVLGPTGSRDYWYLYDVAGATEQAKREQWGHPNGIDAARGLSGSQIAAAAVQADFEYLRGWCNNEWWYVGVIVTHDPSGADASLGCIESTDTAYLESVAHELATEIIIANGTFMRWARKLEVVETLRNMMVDSDALAAMTSAQRMAIMDAIGFLSSEVSE